jgi:arsenate reductase-like glutaredoxin family protein
MVKYELLDWVDINKLDLNDLKIYNPNGIYLYDDGLLSCNTTDKALEHLTKYQDKIEWEFLSSNYNNKALELLIKNPDKIDWYIFSGNCNDNAVEFLLKNHNNGTDFQGIVMIKQLNIYMKINCNTNKKAIDLLKENPDKNKWFASLSRNPSAIELLKENPEKIYWICLSENPNAIELLKENPDKINWKHLSINPSIIIKS